MTSIDPYVTVIPLAEITHDGRVRLIQVGDSYAAPGICLICREAPSETRSFIDFGLNIKVHGALYICNYCFDEVARVFGYVKTTGSALAIAETHIKLQQSKIEELEEKVASFESFINGIDDFVAGWNSTSSNSSDDFSVSEDSKRITEQNESTANEITGARETEINPTSESSSEQGFHDIRGNGTIDSELDGLLEL